MDPRKRLFRRAALEKMASPERLDEMMRVTSPSGWLALAALGAMLATAVAWGIYGSISIKVEGQGILLRGEAVLVVTSGVSGRLGEIVVEPGDVVAAGEVVATVHQAELGEQIEDMRERRNSRIRQRQEQAGRSAGIVAQLRDQRLDLEQKAAQQQELVDKGLLTRSKLLSTRSQISQIDRSIAQEQEKLSGADRQIEEAQRKVDELERRLAGSTEIQSPYAGRVLELAADPGNLVGPGARLLTLEALDGAIDAFLYIPAIDGKKVLPGMEVRVSPSTVRSEEYGFIVGEVKKASEYPVTPEGMERVLRNRELVKTLTGESARIEVVATLAENPSTPSGFRWTSSIGPPSQVFTGTLCSASVIVEKKRPISYVLPILKEAVGTS